LSADSTNKGEKDMLKEMTLAGFADTVASLEPVPGGGSVSALAGALAAALAAMVAALTIRKEQYADLTPLMQGLGTEAANLQNELLNCVDRDADSYRQVLAAFRLPKSTDDEKQKRAAAIQAAFRHATEVPLQVAETALKVLDLAGTAALKGNPDMVTDAGVGVLMARSAALGALMNAKINLSSLKDRNLVNDLETKIADLKQTVVKKEAEILGALKV
jgi:formiminotetrahydrofolate cyclodeaminase